MAGSVKPHTDSHTGDRAPAEAGWALVERVSASADFQKSPRLRELFEYLCRCVLQDPHSAISEHQIGVAIFGWPPHYDSGTDTIVRVQASQLRRKLEHYFLTDGQAEPVVIEIPRGSYAPVFRPREQARGEEAAPLHAVPAPAAPPRPPPQRWTTRVVVVACALSVAATLCASIIYLKLGPALAHTPTPALDQFWRPFQNGRSAQVVVSDANLIILSDVLQHTVTLHEYRNPQYPRLLFDPLIKDVRIRELADNVANTHMTGLQDASILPRLTELSAHYRFPTTTISARDFRMPQPDNLILLGHKKGNPWVELFEDRMNFRYEFDWSTRIGKIVNIAPLKGEQASYSAEYGRHGYCVVACLPKPMDEGVALVVFGSDMSSLGAGGRFIADEKSIGELYARLRGRPTDPPPYFEVLLRTRLLMNLAPGYEIIAHRAVKL